MESNDLAGARDTSQASAKLRGLYVITDEHLGGGHLAIARAAIFGGASILQLRDKSTPIPRLLPIAHQIRQMTIEAGVLFFVNDRVDIAQAAQADGVHLGPDDFPAQDARHLLGPGALIGVSCGTVTEARQALANGADYIGAGAIFGTSTKADAGEAIGLDALRALIAATPLPVAAIGGINFNNLGQVLAAGAAMACVISAVTNAGSQDAMTAEVQRLALSLALVESKGSPYNSSPLTGRG